MQTLLARCLSDDVHGRSILGDLHEALGSRYRERDPRAPIWYAWQAIRLVVLYGPRSLFSKFAAEGNPMTGLAQDAIYAFRSIRRDVRFFVFAALIIGLGVGANTAVFSVMSPLMLRPLPFESSDRLVWVAGSAEGGMSDMTSRTSNLRDYRERNRSFEALTGYNAFFDYGSYNLTGEGQPERLVGVDVAHDFLDVLGVRPLLGRTFLAEEGAWGASVVAILTHGFWTRRFAADPSIVGRSITLNNQPVEVIGVLPASFDFASTFTPASRVDFLRPFPISDETDRWGNTLSIVGRLRPGATVENAQADLDAIIQQLQQEQPDRWGLRAVVSGLQDHIVGRFRPAMSALAAAAAAVLLIACVNLSNLLLARAPKRQKEMAVRSALGAGRHRLVRQLLVESVMLALLGAVMGVFIALAVTRAVSGAGSIGIPMLHAVSINGTALLFTLGISSLAGILIGVLPSLQISDDRSGSVIREATRRTSESKRHTRLREILVVAEVALACVLLVSGGLLLRSFVSLLDVDLGFEPGRAMAWRVDTRRDFENHAARVAFYDQLTETVASVPGVEAVGLTDTTPLGRNRGWGVGAVGVVYERGERPGFFPRMVDWRYLETMGIPLLSGRYLNAYDTGDSAPVVVMNATAAERLFPGESAIGRSVEIWPRTWEVVGVVGDVRHAALEEASGLEIYMPITQQDDWGTQELIVRSSVPPETIIDGVRAALSAVDPSMPTGDYRTLDSIVNRAVSPRRFILVLLGGFAGTALLLAALGIYGVLSYTVTQRIPEIGIRMALGESSVQVLARVLGRTMALAGLGILLGALGSVIASRLIGSMLFGIGTTDPVTFSMVMAILLLAAALAGFLPARRAARTDPAIALQST